MRGIDLFKSEDLKGKAFDLVEKYKNAEPTPDSILSQFHVDADLGADMARVNKKFQAPEEVNAMIAAWDAFTNLFKGNVTAPFPSFHTRNLMSGFVQNVLNDVTDPRFTGWKKHIQPYLDAKELMSGKVIEDASEMPIFQKKHEAWTNELKAEMAAKANRQGPLSGKIKNKKQKAIPTPTEQEIKKYLDERATEEIQTMIFAQRLVDSPGQHNDLIGNISGTILDQLVGSRSFADKMAPPPGTSKLDRWTPWKTRGVSGDVDAFAPVRIGRAVGDQSEQMLRSAPFIALLRQGVDPDEAARMVKRLQVDYSDLTDVERKVLRRAVPFYTFQKGSTKYLANELASRPGGKVAMTIKAAENASGNDPGTPEYVRDGLNIPVGSNEDGARHYITGAGLMHEPPMQLLGPSVADTLFNAAKMLHPGIKAPLELMTNESLFMEGPG